MIGRNCLVIIPMQLGRNKPNFSFDVPDTFAATALSVKQKNVICVSLRMIACDQTYQGRLARSVSTFQQPSLPAVDLPVDVRKDHFLSVSHRHVLKFYGNIKSQGII